MGVHASRFKEQTTNSSLADLSYSDSNWIVSHADATSLHYPQVERLWLRFQQLGADKNGILKASTIHKQHMSSNPFEEKLLTSLLTADDGVITFHTFLREMKWAERAAIEQKVAGVFHLLNDGRAITKEDLTKIVKQLYPDDEENDITNNTALCMQQMDDKSNGYIEESQFVRWVLSMRSDPAVEQLLNFHIIPPEVEGRVQQQVANYNSPPSTPVGRAPIPTNEMLQQIASRVQRRDWHFLANKLGFTSRNIEEFEQKYQRDATKQVYEMLVTWRRKEGSRGVTIVLERALRESNMNDIALLLV